MIEQLREDVAALAAPGTREVGSPGHEGARRYLRERLEGLGAAGYGDDGYEWPYEVGGQAFVNVFAQVPGANAAASPVLIAAHYDTCGAQPGADDNAAAMAIALAVGERLLTEPSERRVILAFFDAEEPPYYLSPAMGSVHFHENQRTEDIHCPLVMDLVGHDTPIMGLGDALFLTGMESDPGLAEVIQRAKQPEGIRPVPTLNRYIGDQSDYHIFRVNRRPYLFLTCARWEHYHAPTDTPEKLNYEKMAHIAAYLETLVRETARQPLDGPFEGYDSTPVELEFLQSAAGPIADAFGIPLESRKDIDRIAQVLMAQFSL
ncbi:MAG: M28 family peptidase [Candidatus Hydrogenedentota bacterium]